MRGVPRFGLAPLALNDASGVNFISDVTHVHQLADMLGFKEADILRGLNLLEQVWLILLAPSWM